MVSQIDGDSRCDMWPISARVNPGNVFHTFFAFFIFTATHDDDDDDDDEFWF